MEEIKKPDPANVDQKQELRADNKQELNLEEVLAAFVECDESFEKAHKRLSFVARELSMRKKEVCHIVEVFDKVIFKFNENMTVFDSFEGVKVIRISSEIKKLTASQKSLNDKIDELVGYYKKNANALVAIRSAINERIGGIGINEVKFGPMLNRVSDVMTDSGFEKAIRLMERASNPNFIMQAACDGIKEVPSAKECMIPKIKKMQERIKLAKDKNAPEILITKNKLKDLIDKDGVIDNRAKILIGKHGQAAKKSLSRTLGLLEKLKDSVDKAGVAHLVRGNMDNLGEVIEELNKINHKLND